MFGDMEKSLDKLRGALLEFDGRSLTTLSEAEARFSVGSNYLSDLVSLSLFGEGRVADGATWLIKYHLENGGTLPEEVLAHLTTGIAEVQRWSAQLHICQSVQYLQLSKMQAKTLIVWLQPLLNHQRPFLRAWSLDAVSRISRRHSVYERILKTALELALVDPAPSVRARTRNLGK